MSLQNWLNNGWLVEHRTSPQEIADLFGVADRDLSDCQVTDISPDWRMNIAYNAALQAATAALAAAGYRAAREAHHYRVIQSLAFTIGADSKLITRFDSFRKKRNIGGYEQAGLVSNRETDEMIALAKQLRKNTEKWIRDNYPQLLR